MVSRSKPGTPVAGGRRSSSRVSRSKSATSMPMIVRARSFPSHLWPSLLVGAVFGAGLSWLAVRGRFREQVEADLDELTARLRAWPGAEELHMGSFGHGICELVGRAGGDLDIAALIEALADEPGVSAVVNRVWNAESG